MKLIQTKNGRRLALLAVVGAMGVLAQPAFATLSYSTSGNTVGGLPVDASASISISGNTMTVVLTDNYANPSSVGSVLNGVTINMSGVSGVSGLTANGATTVNLSGSTPVYGSASGSTIASAYSLSAASSAITLTAIGGGQPKYLIIGPAGYSSANGSLQNGAHNPFILQTETFQFLLSGSTSFSEDDISGITFLFGTSSDYAPPTTTTSVPEPSTVVAGALLLLPFGVSTIRILRKNKQNSVA